jgi:hypothetical protein
MSATQVVRLPLVMVAVVMSYLVTKDLARSLAVAREWIAAARSASVHLVEPKPALMHRFPLTVSVTLALPVWGFFATPWRQTGSFHRLQVMCCTGTMGSAFVGEALVSLIRHCPALVRLNCAKRVFKPAELMQVDELLAARPDVTFNDATPLACAGCCKPAFIDSCRGHVTCVHRGRCQACAPLSFCQRSSCDRRSHGVAGCRGCSNGDRTSTNVVTPSRSGVSVA